MPSSGSGTLGAAVSAGYPGAEDLQSFLEAAELTLSAELLAQLPTAIAAARKDFENTVDRIMLAPADAAVRRFDPPAHWRDGGATLFLKRDLAAVTSVVYQPSGSDAETLTEGEDYELEPYDAPEDGQPYTRIRFLVRRWTGPLSARHRGSIRVTGRWGYATEIPEDAWLAMCARGAWRLFGQIAQASTGGMLGWSDADRKVDYGVETWGRLRDIWAAQYDGAVNNYKRWEL